MSEIPDTRGGAPSVLPSVRRVVTGHDAAGRSKVLSDESLQLRGPPGHNQGVAGLWGTDGVPTNDGPGEPAATPVPVAGGNSFVIVQYPPESDLERMTPQQRAVAMASPADHVPGLIKADTARHYGMHFSETVDYGVVLSGEMTMLLDEGEVVLRAGDILVQRGTAHAWSNRGSEPVVMAVVILGAEPMARHKT
jgi:mannose-6-phosphate isomerase-like protein (cupin superfamily)